MVSTINNSGRSGLSSTPVIPKPRDQDSTSADDPLTLLREAALASALNDVGHWVSVAEQESEYNAEADTR